MEIASALYTHNDDELCLDTLDSIKMWMTEKVMVVVDEANAHNYKGKIKDTIVKKGLHHGSSRSTHKNMSFSIEQLYYEWQDVEWYCFMEPDVLILDGGFKKDLQGGWIRGTNHRHGPDWELPLLDKIVGRNVPISCYFLGCIMFLHNQFVKKLVEVNFFKRLMEFTKHYESHVFPDFNGYSFQEEMFPSIANAFMENSDVPLVGHRYFCRWPVEVQPDELPPGVSIVHPIKDYNNPIRNHARKIRNEFREFLKE